jgi:ABC-type transport system involved in multi-copper enzyme maturation permease subunit
MTWILIAIVVGIEVIFYGGMTIAHFVRPNNQDLLESLRLATIEDNGLSLVALIGSILVAVFASSLIGSEFGWNTLRPLLARARTRSSLLTAKWLTVVLYVATLAVIGVVTTITAATIASVVAGEGTVWSVSTIIDTVAISGRFVMGLLPMAALAMFVAVLTRSNAAGIAISIAYGFIEPVVFLLLSQVSDVFDTIKKGAIYWNTDRLFTLGGNNDLTARDAWLSAGVLTLWVALFVAVSYRVFNRRDVTSG